MGKTGAAMAVVKELNEEALKEELARVAGKGITALAVLLLHSYNYPIHEQRVKVLATEAGFTHVSVSSEVSPMVKAVPRGFTACSDAYLTPKIKQYLDGFRRGFQDSLKGVSVSFMKSDGGLTLMDSFNGSHAILSGPAGGVVGFAGTTYRQQHQLFSAFTRQQDA